MKVDLQLIPFEQKEILRKMLKKYERELTGENDPGEYKYLDLYWEKETRKPFFITVDGVISGFALINRHTIILKDGNNIAEFYIEKAYRNKGVGKEAAIKVFNLFPGEWEARELTTNPKAQAFWKKVIAEFTHNHYEEVWLDDDKWRGAIQTFAV